MRKTLDPLKIDNPAETPDRGAPTGCTCSGYFFFFVAFSGGVTMEEGFVFLESDLFLFTGGTSASFFFFK
jgi:hypothetical protein